MSFAMFVLWMMMQQKPKHAHLEIQAIRWAYEDSGWPEMVPCDPPVPKDSGIVCSRKTLTWQGYCDDPRTIDILPRVDGASFDPNEAHAKGEKYWCVLAVED